MKRTLSGYAHCTPACLVIELNHIKAAVLSLFLTAVFLFCSSCSLSHAAPLAETGTDLQPLVAAENRINTNERKPVWLQAWLKSLSKFYPLKRGTLPERQKKKHDLKNELTLS